MENKFPFRCDRRIGFARLSCWENYSKCGSDAWRALAFDGAALNLHDRLCDSQTQATALSFAATGWRGAIEPFKNERQVLTGDPYALIREGCANMPVAIL